MKAKSLQIACLIYVLLVGFGQVFLNDSALWNSFYYIREHLFIIVLLLVIKSFLQTFFSKIIIWGIIVYKIELILFNVCLAFLNKDSYDQLCLSYDVAIIFTALIWLITALWLLLKLKKR
jgi:hypothetical protein